MKRLLGVVVVIGLLAAGCASDSSRVNREPVRAPNLKPVAGYRIVLDAGHGEPWPGAVAPANGLEESDVNLRVALRLQEMLAKAGADVVMTRRADGAVDASSLGADLAARARIANEAQADAFVSIHHNAGIALGAPDNDLEVYYKAGEPGPSLALAEELIHALAINVRRDAPAKLLYPGNYRVLRLAEVPAVLLESSYMTHKGNARYLATEEGVMAEANSIAAGLAGYFAMKPPRIVQADALLRPDGKHQVNVLFVKDTPVMPDSVYAMLDGELLAGAVAAFESVPETGQIRLAWVSDAPPANGGHVLELRGRNALGAPFLCKTELNVNRPPDRFHVIQQPAQINRASAVEVCFTVGVYDAWGLPVADGTEVRDTSSGITARTHAGMARFYFAAGMAPQSLTLQADTVTTQHTSVLGSASARSVRVRRGDTREPVADAYLSFGGADDPSHSATTNRDGWAVLPGHIASVSVKRPGFDTADITLQGDHQQIDLRPVEDGALIGRAITLDPAHGGRDAGSLGPGGLRASDVNLAVAQRLAALLRQAGANVTFTRGDDLERGDFERVMAVQEIDPEVCVAISFGASHEDNRVIEKPIKQRLVGGGFVGHYPGSEKGGRLAQMISSQLDGLPVRDSVAFILQHTPCPAVLVQPADVADGAVTTRFRNPAALDAAATSIYRGLVQYFAAAG